MPSKPATEPQTNATTNPRSGDKRLRALLKPLLPADAKLEPLTLEGGIRASEAGGMVPTMGLETRKDMVKLPTHRRPLEFITFRLHTLSTFVPKAKADALVARIQPKVRPHGYQALVAAQQQLDFASLFGTGVRSASKEFGDTALLVFYAAAEPFGLLYARGTNGTNLGQGLGPGDIVRRLKQWDGECKCTLIGAGFDWAKLRFKTLPKDVTRFGGELYLLCPAGFPNDPDDGMPDAVWDRPPEEQDDLAPPIGRAFGFRTAADVEPYFGPKNELFLWWD